jgi:hypothetical protein
MPAGDGGFGRFSPDGANEFGGFSGCAGAAAGGADSLLGCGAGLGTGTFCAIAAAVRPARMVHATAARLAFRIASSAPTGGTYRAGMAISRLRLGNNPRPEHRRSVPRPQ